MTSDENFSAMLDMISQVPTVKAASLILDGGGTLTLDSEAHGVFSSQHSLIWPWVVKAVLAELLSRVWKANGISLQIQNLVVDACRSAKSRRYAEGARYGLALH